MLLTNLTGNLILHGPLLRGKVNYEFCPKRETPNRTAIQRMVGNAVPPKLAETLGEAIMSRDNNL